MANLTRKSLLLSRHFPVIFSARFKSITGNPTADRALNTVTAGKIGGWLKQYEDFTGLTEVKSSQTHVLEMEKQFQERQKERRNKQQQLTNIQARLRNVTSELEKASRGTDLYIELVTKENDIIKEERALLEVMENSEQLERDTFSELSSAVRDSHEKERQYSERTKYWSVTGSFVGVVLGIIGSAINNKLRLNELWKIISMADQKADNYKEIAGELYSALEREHSKLETLVNSSSVSTNKEQRDRKSDRNTSKTFSDIERQSKEILTAIQNQDKMLDQKLGEIQKIVATQTVIESGSDGSVVYVGPEVKGMLNETEQNLEWKMKLNALWTVTFIYGALALTLPVVFSIFKGS